MRISSNLKPLPFDLLSTLPSIRVIILGFNTKRTIVAASKKGTPAQNVGPVI